MSDTEQLDPSMMKSESFKPMAPDTSNTNPFPTGPHIMDEKGQAASQAADRMAQTFKDKAADPAVIDPVNIGSPLGVEKPAVDTDGAYSEMKTSTFTSAVEALSGQNKDVLSSATPTPEPGPSGINIAKAAGISAERIEGTNQGLTNDALDNAVPGFPSASLDPEAHDASVPTSHPPELANAEDQLYKGNLPPVTPAEQ